MARFREVLLNHARKKPAIFSSGLNDERVQNTQQRAEKKHGTALFKCVIRTRFRKVTTSAGSKKRLPAAGAFSTYSSSIVLCAPGEAHSGYRHPLQPHKRSRYHFSSYLSGVTLLT